MAYVDWYIEAREFGTVRSPLMYALRGYSIMMTNPKAVLAWIAIMSLGIQHGAPFWVGGVIAAGTVTLSVVIHVFYALAFSTPVMARAYARARRYIQATVGVFFALAGLRLLASRT